MTAETQKSHVQNRVTCCVTVREAFKQCHAMNFAKTSSIKLDSETCFKSHPSEFQATGVRGTGLFLSSSSSSSFL